MALILDTNALSAFADGDRALGNIIEDEMDLALPAVVLGEYFYGVRHSRMRKRYEAWLETNLHGFQVLRIGQRTAEHYAEIRSELKASGKPIPSNAVWIAALVREHGHPLLSRGRHFEAVRGLRRIDW